MNILVNNKPTETDAVNLKELAAKLKETPDSMSKTCET